MLVRSLETNAKAPTVEVRYPMSYPDRRAEIEYRWKVPLPDWIAAQELVDEEPSLGALRFLDCSTRTVNRLALFDGYDFGSADRREAIRQLCHLLLPASVAVVVGLPNFDNRPTSP